MNKNHSKEIIVRKELVLSKLGYFFNPSDDYWRLDKRTNIPVGEVRFLLDTSIANEYIDVLVFYASNLSAMYVKNINASVLHLLRTTGVTFIDCNALINYRATLNRNTEWYLAVIRSFLKKWNELGYHGISDDVIELLSSWTLKGNIKGDVVKRLDPVSGPLSDIELQAFNEGAIQAYERNAITLTELGLSLLVSHTGRRPIQISYLRLKDILKGKNKKGETMFLVNVPRAKQRGTTFREVFKQFAITEDLWVILNAQAKQTTKEIEKIIGFELQDSDRLDLPLFPDFREVSKIKSPVQLRKLLKIDLLHVNSKLITKSCKNITEVSNVHSERTNSKLAICARRFRYTIGTRAAREGFGEMVIAELLDHSDTSSAGVYTKNIPEHVEKLDQAVGHYLAPYAQAFAGTLVNSELGAKRGDDLNSRVKTSGKNIGTCGSYGFCGANAPIPCYTCIHFQPWLDGPHEIVYDNLIDERERLLDITGDNLIAAVNDRSILAVAEVIRLCELRRNGNQDG